MANERPRPGFGRGVTWLDWAGPGPLRVFPRLRPWISRAIHTQGRWTMDDFDAIIGDFTVKYYEIVWNIRWKSRILTKDDIVLVWDLFIDKIIAYLAVLLQRIRRVKMIPNSSYFFRKKLLIEKKKGDLRHRPKSRGLVTAVPKVRRGF